VLVRGVHPRHPRHPRHLRHFASLASLLASLLASAAPYTHRFTATSPAEIVATVAVRCDRCAWEIEGREAVVLKVTLDGRYVQHLPVVRTGRAEYQLLIGEVAAGPHSLEIEEDAALTARDLRGGAATIETIAVTQILKTSPDYRAIAFAPILYARPNTVGRFTDVPVFMWYEIEPTARGTRYRYSVIFTNEDGGTPADRLMATWGRTTDIEYVHSIEADRDGGVLDADMQGPDHEILPFRGVREGLHPLLWVSSDNNMVLDRGTTAVRYAPAPIPFPLREVSREAVMDAHPWTYAVAARELMREGKIAADAPPGHGQIPDPRRFVYVEACGELSGAALAFALRVKNDWISSDRGVQQYRIARDGCFRAAIPVPASVTPRDITGLRARAHTRPASGSSPPPAAGTVRLTRINRMFMLDDDFRPQASFLEWRGARSLAPDGPPVEIATPHE
jgi:hypothetical protein